jgi:hypothetical protein
MDREIHTNEAFEYLSCFVTLLLNACGSEKSHVEILSSRDIARNVIEFETGDRIKVRQGIKTSFVRCRNTEDKG